MHYLRKIYKSHYIHNTHAVFLTHITDQLSHPYMTTGKTISLTRLTLVGKVMSLLLNMLSRLLITFLPRCKRLLISWLQSPSAVSLEPRKIKSDTVSTLSPSISHKVMGPDATRVQFLCQEDPVGEKNGNPLQYSCLENFMERGAWQAAVCGVTESDTTDTFIHHITHPIAA